jgi:hypothetical protein
MQSVHVSDWSTRQQLSPLIQSMADSCLIIEHSSLLETRSHVSSYFIYIHSRLSILNLSAYSCYHFFLLRKRMVRIPKEKEDEKKKRKKEMTHSQLTPVVAIVVLWKKNRREQNGIRPLLSFLL